MAQNIIIPITTLAAFNNSSILIGIQNLTVQTESYTIKFFDVNSNLLLALTFSIIVGSSNPYLLNITITQSVLTVSANIGPQNSFQTLQSNFDTVINPQIIQISVLGDVGLNAVVINNTIFSGGSASMPVSSIPPTDPFAFWFSFAGVIVLVVLIAVLLWILVINAQLIMKPPNSNQNINTTNIQSTENVQYTPYYYLTQ
jgi:hypothetical protein